MWGHSRLGLVLLFLHCALHVAVEDADLSLATAQYSQEILVSDEDAATVTVSLADPTPAVEIAGLYCAGKDDRLLEGFGCKEVMEGLVQAVRRRLIYKFTTLEITDRLIGRGYPAGSIEGSSFNFLAKVAAMQEVASDPRVQTVCEIGFNAGHSAALFLASNPRVNVVSFDLGSNRYALDAADLVLQLFPNRHTLIMGDSNRTVPAFSSLTGGGTRCQLILIDGAHSLEGAAADLVHANALVDPAYHRLLMDDTVPATLGSAQAWQRALAAGDVRELRVVDDEYSTCVEDLQPPGISTREDRETGVSSLVVQGQKVCSDRPAVDLAYAGQWSSRLTVGEFTSR